MGAGLNKMLVGVVSTLVYLWIAVTALIVLVGCLFTAAEDSNLGLGLVQVQGLWAVVVGLSLGSIGLGAIILVWRGYPVGGHLLCIYCAFFVLSLGAAVVRDLVESRKALPAALPEELPLLVIIAGFLLTLLWTWSLSPAARSKVQ